MKFCSCLSMTTKQHEESETTIDSSLHFIDPKIRIQNFVLNDTYKLKT